MSTNTLKISRFVSGLAAAALVFGVAACGSGGNDEPTKTDEPTATEPATTEPTEAPAQTLEGKKVLMIPYWLDNFGAAWGQWTVTLFEEQGVEVTLVSTDAETTKQLDAIEAAIGSLQYDAIIWQPIDADSATATALRIQEAGIAQVIFNADFEPGQDGLHTPQIQIDNVSGFGVSGQVVAQAVMDNPELGDHVKLAWLGAFPAIPICDNRRDALIEGIKSVDPNMELVYEDGIASVADANSKIADLITSQADFNVYFGCGGNQGIGGGAAIDAAGLGGAVDNVPVDIVQGAEDTPPELVKLWDPSSSVITGMTMEPKRFAQVSVELLSRLMTGALAIDSDEILKEGLTSLTTDCQASRAIIEENYQSIPNFEIPECQ